VELTPGIRREAAPDLDATGQDEDLVARIHDEIDRQGPITFARFMELALYDPTGGYYRASDARPGRDGDFLTAPETHPIFGSAIARALEEIWDRLDRPDPFVLREYGAGTGTLALAVLDQLDRDGSPLAQGIRYDPVEIEPRRLETIAERFRAAGRAGVLPGRAAAANAGTGAGIVGMVLGNEVLDALPTHRVVVREGRLLEVFVGTANGEFMEVDAPPTNAALQARLDADGITLAEGQRAEVCLALEPWLAQAAAGLERGVLLVIDYGYPARELYDPVRRPAGTLRAYLRHRVHDDPFRHIGRQDLTAHVDVTAIEAAAAAAGLSHLGTTTQAEFLMGLGIQDLLQAIQRDPATSLDAYLAVRSGLMRLLDPAAMGRFRVMGFGRGLPTGPPLTGFAYRLPSR
jgi:SAM-dependent MidA family methyltransferase